MELFRKSLDYLIASSILTAFSALALLKITQIEFEIPNNSELNLFTFWGTLISYNFIKYFSWLQSKKNISQSLFSIIIISVIGLIICFKTILLLQKDVQISSLIILIIVLLYTIPINRKYKNFRNLPQIKIYLVLICWLIVTCFIPYFQLHTFDFNKAILFSIQRSCLLFILLLLFELYDLHLDKKELKTIPQLLGIDGTKKIGMFIILIYILIGYTISNSIIYTLFCGFVLTQFLLHSSENQSKYYTAVGVESISIIFWCILELIRTPF